ncbi:MAG: aldehyde dehydrogenase family protein, partial [Mycobacterium sp.]
TDPARLDGLLDTAVAEGAIVTRSSAPAPAAGHFASPAVCLSVPADHVLRTDEIFGPAVTVNSYTDLDEVLAATRHGRYGLGGYVVGPSERATAFARALDVGIVGVNNATPNTPQVPFGGIKHSGYGWEGGEVGLDAFLSYRTVAVASQS